MNVETIVCGLFVVALLGLLAWDVVRDHRAVQKHRREIRGFFERRIRP
jgi:hypothetical protein